MMCNLVFIYLELLATKKDIYKTEVGLYVCCVSVFADILRITFQKAIPWGVRLDKGKGVLL